ncbi:MAG: divalent-cation tolerance protein CutA [Gemmatimonadota bacterium]
MTGGLQESGPPEAVLVVLVTGPDVETLARLGRAVIEERLAACVNIVDRAVSIFRWEGAVREEAEAVAIFKTTPARLESLQARVLELHPYDEPEFLALPVAAGSPSYLNWVVGEVEPGSGG